MEGTVISVRYQRLIELCGYDYDVELGRFPAGTYTVVVQGQAPVQFTVGPSSSTPAAPYPGNQPVVDYSGMWWTPSESGWGLSISQGATNQVFAVWFVYGQSGEPTWYTLQPGSWTSSNVYSTYTGPIYKTDGPLFRRCLQSSLRGSQASGHRNTVIPIRESGNVQVCRRRRAGREGHRTDGDRMSGRH